MSTATPADPCAAEREQVKQLREALEGLLVALLVDAGNRRFRPSTQTEEQIERAYGVIDNTIQEDQ